MAIRSAAQAADHPDQQVGATAPEEPLFSNLQLQQGAVFRVPVIQSNGDQVFSRLTTVLA